MSFTKMLKTPLICRVSVVVCTHNRSNYLGRTINSLLHQTLPRELYEIVIVDNGSIDDTASIVKKHKKESVRYVYDPNRGLSNARNTGARESRGDIVAYIDDDAVASPFWIERILNAFSLNDEIAAAGGRIEPWWEVEKPDWITPNLYPYFSCIDWGDKPFYLEKGKYLFGCNMAFRKSMLLDCGGFSPRLGRVGNNLLSNEEWDVFKQIDKRGLKKYYDPDISVQHIVTKSRMTWKWLRARLYWQGISNLYYDYFNENFTKTALLKKYSKEIGAFFLHELSRLVRGKGDPMLLWLFISRYLGTCVHFMKICSGLTKRA